MKEVHFVSVKTILMAINFAIVLFLEEKCFLELYWQKLANWLEVDV
jgi:hypothetical protein